MAANTSTVFLSFRTPVGYPQIWIFYGTMTDKQNLLIVDDEPAITQSLRRSLRENFVVFTANSGVEALEILKNNEIAVILTDQRMPNMSGVDFLQAAREVQPNSLSVILSGYSDVQALIAALNISSVRGFIPKPWDGQELLGKLEQAAKEYQVVFKDPQFLQVSSTQAMSEMQQQVNDLKRLVETLTLGMDTNHETDSLTEQQTDAAEREAASLQNLYPAQPAGVSSRMLGLLPLNEANPQKFEELKKEYILCLEQAFEQRVYKVKYPISAALKTMSNELGFMRAGPRDVVELHNQGIKAIFELYLLPRRQVYLEEGRLLILELMGNLVQFYRANISRQVKE